MIEILLIRHGETAWNAEKRMQGHLDIGLNAAGVRQAAALGLALQHEPLDAVFSSDLKRAFDTAQALATSRGLPVGTDVGLRERCFGIFEGQLYADLEACDSVAYTAWKSRDLDARYPAGERVAETLREFSVRSLATLDRLAAHGGHRRIAIVTHGGVLECIYRAATNTSLQQARDFDIPNAGVNRVQWDAGKMQILDWANVNHLDIAALDECMPECIPERSPRNSPGRIQ
ncbi:MAG: histidine phosphatase family protein [Pseudomonadota bacterium]